MPRLVVSRVSLGTNLRLAYVCMGGRAYPTISLRRESSTCAWVMMTTSLCLDSLIDAFERVIKQCPSCGLTAGKSLFKNFSEETGLDWIGLH